MIKEAFKSLLTVASISSLCGSAGYLLDKSFLGIFLASTAIQFILGYAIASYTSYDFKKSAYIAELDKLEKLSTILNCAYCNEPSLVTFLPDTPPTLACEKCNNTSNVKMQFSVARQTSPPVTLSALSEPQKNHNIKL
jgi:hypothetical protein